MPERPPRACANPTCPNAVVSGSFCPEHSPVIPPKEEKSLYAWRNPEHSKLYGNARWRKKTCPAIKRRDPICKSCGRQPSTEVDHIKDHRGDPHLFWDFANLQGLCKPCHGRKTGKEHGFNRTEPQEPFFKNGRVNDIGAHLIAGVEQILEPTVDYSELLTRHKKFIPK